MCKKDGNDSLKACNFIGKPEIAGNLAGLNYLGVQVLGTLRVSGRDSSVSREFPLLASVFGLNTHSCIFSIGPTVVLTAGSKSLKI